MNKPADTIIADTFARDAAAIASGESIIASVLLNGRVCVLWKDADRFFMQHASFDASPAHVLDIACTSVERLAAHWRGFCGVETTTAEQPAAAEAEALSLREQLATAQEQLGRAYARKAAVIDALPRCTPVPAWSDEAREACEEVDRLEALSSAISSRLFAPSPELAAQLHAARAGYVEPSCDAISRAERAIGA